MTFLNNVKFKLSVDIFGSKLDHLQAQINWIDFTLAWVYAQQYLDIVRALGSIARVPFFFTFSRDIVTHVNKELYYNNMAFRCDFLINKLSQFEWSGWMSFLYIHKIVINWVFLLKFSIRFAGYLSIDMK